MTREGLDYGTTSGGLQVDASEAGLHFPTSYPCTFEQTRNLRQTTCFRAFPFQKLKDSGDNVLLPGGVLGVAVSPKPHM